MNSQTRSTNSHEHLDPITGAPGAHPAGTGIGAASGGIAGAAAGIVGGPVGMAVGATVGAVAGGLAGKAAAESLSPTTAAVDEAASNVGDAALDAIAEDTYWRGQFKLEPYYLQGCPYDDYAPAYLTGYLGHARLAGKAYEEIEGDLERDYSANRGGSGLSWIEAKPATRAAWNRVQGMQSGTPA
jgi:hypothetical protein